MHYYEDGNVRLESGQAPPASSSSADEAARSEMEIAPKATPHDTARAIVKEIAAFERTYQEGVDRDLDRLAEGAFKQLRRTLPVTLQRMEWDKLEGYRAIRLMGGGGKGATDVKRP